jgi:hypothetical protein
MAIKASEARRAMNGLDRVYDDLPDTIASATHLKFPGDSAHYRIEDNQEQRLILVNESTGERSVLASGKFAGGRDGEVALYSGSSNPVIYQSEDIRLFGYTEPVSQYARAAGIGDDKVIMCKDCDRLPAKYRDRCEECQERYEERILTLLHSKSPTERMWAGTGLKIDKEDLHLFENK